MGRYSIPHQLLFTQLLFHCSIYIYLSVGDKESADLTVVQGMKHLVDAGIHNGFAHERQGTMLHVEGIQESFRLYACYENVIIRDIEDRAVKRRNKC